jgi:hypothetical protein
VLLLLCGSVLLSGCSGFAGDSQAARQKDELADPVRDPFQNALVFEDKDDEAMALAATADGKPEGPGEKAEPATDKPADPLKDDKSTEPAKETKDNTTAAVETKPNKNGIFLASEILTRAKNPFLKKLPKVEQLLGNEPELPELPTPGGKGGKSSANPIPDLPPSMPVVDPLTDVRLSGIVFNPARPLALLNMPDPTSSGGVSNRIVRKGDVLATASGSVKVINITRNAVEVAEVGKLKNKKTLVLPDVVGYVPGQSSDSVSRPGMGNSDPILNLPTGGSGGQVGLNPPPLPSPPGARPAPSSGGSSPPSLPPATASAGKVKPILSGLEEP